MDEHVRKLIGNWLRKARIDRNLRAIEVANKVKIHDTRLSKIENGHKEARPDELERLQAVLGEMPSELQLLYERQSNTANA